MLKFKRISVLIFCWVSACFSIKFVSVSVKKRGKKQEEKSGKFFWKLCRVRVGKIENKSWLLCHGREHCCPVNGFIVIGNFPPLKEEKLGGIFTISDSSENFIALRARQLAEFSCEPTSTVKGRKSQQERRVRRSGKSLWEGKWSDNYIKRKIQHTARRHRPTGGARKIVNSKAVINLGREHNNKTKTKNRPANSDRLNFSRRLADLSGEFFNLKHRKRKWGKSLMRRLEVFDDVAERRWKIVMKKLHPNHRWWDWENSRERLPHGGVRNRAKNRRRVMKC